MGKPLAKSIGWIKTGDLPLRTFGRIYYNFCEFILMPRLQTSVHRDHKYSVILFEMSVSTINTASSPIYLICINSCSDWF